VRPSRADLKGMMQRGWGRIVFLSSESGLNMPADMIHYWFHKNGGSRDLARPRQARRRHRRHGERGATWADAVGRRGGDAQGHR
jgi:hypothetical protein